MGNAFYCLAGKMVGCFGCNATNRNFVLPYPSQPIPGKGHVHQRQLAVGTLFNSQQRRALAVPRLNRWSTAGQPRVNRGLCSSTGLHRISFVRACEETFRTVVYGTLGG